MGVRMRGLAAVAALGIAAAVAGCGSGDEIAATFVPGSGTPSAGPPSTAPSSSPTGAPAGYHRIGGTDQGISVEVPDDYTVIDMDDISTDDESLDKLGLTGVTPEELKQQMAAVAQYNAVMAFDLRTAQTGFVSNISAYCVDSGIPASGSSVVPLIKSTMTEQFEQKLGAQNVTADDKEVGGVAGVETRYSLPSSTIGSIEGGQLEVAPSSNTMCFVTLTTPGGKFDDSVLAVAAQTAQFG